MNSIDTFLFELKRRLDASGLKYEDSGREICVQNSESTPTVVQIEDLNVLGVDGRLLSHRVTVTKRCLNPAHGVLEKEFLSRWNSYASILSVVPEGSYVDIVARLNLYEGAPDVSKHVHAPLVFWAAWLAPGIAAFLEDGEPNAVSFIKGKAPKVDPWWFGVPNDAAEAAPPFTQEDLEDTQDYLSECGLLSSVGSGGISLELPWDRDAMGVFYDTFAEEELSDSGRTALLVVELTAEHPLFGKGVLVQYRTPITTSEHTAEIVNRLNNWELGGGDLPPFFGSWCHDPSSASPAFVMFIPTMVGRTVTMISLVNWMGQRHKAVMTFLKSIGSH